MLKRSDVERFIPNDGDTFDVIVAGGGPAGIGAALGAAMNGAKTLILESRAFFGGVAGVSGWMPINRLLLNGGSRGGVHELFVNKLQSMGPDACREGKTSWVDGDGLHVHPDYLRLGVLELLEETGCYYCLHSPVTGVEMDDKRITKVICDGKYGKSTYSSKVFVDATGDGDVAYYAGASFQKGRESDGALMPVTVGFVIGNVDEEKLFTGLANLGYDAYTSIIKNASSEGYSTSIFYSFDKTTIPGVISVNNGGQSGIGIIDATNIRDVNLSERTGLQVAMDFVKIVREKKLPGLENCCLVRTGADLGVRETRRIVGDYVMTMEDAQEGKEFDDIVARRYGTIDPGGLKEARDYHGTIQNGHAYPYRCLLPKGIDGLLVAGRCASLTHLGLTVCKSMGNMMGVGQAAGVAAALSAKANILPRDLDYHLIQDTLKEMNVPL
jgi:hypothetical protein